MAHFFKNLLIYCVVSGVIYLQGACQSWRVFGERKFASATPVAVKKHLWLHLPGAFAGLEDFAIKTIQSAASTLNEIENIFPINASTESAKLETIIDQIVAPEHPKARQLHDIMRTTIFAYYNAHTARRINLVGKDPLLNSDQLGLCACMGLDTRLLALVHLATHILDRYPETIKPLTITELGSGELLTQYILNTILIDQGYTRLTLRLIDPIYADSDTIIRTHHLRLIALFKKLIADYLISKQMPPWLVSIRTFSDVDQYFSSLPPKNDVIIMFDVGSSDCSEADAPDEAINEYRFQMTGKKPAFIILPKYTQERIALYTPKEDQKSYTSLKKLLETATNRRVLAAAFKSAPGFSGSCNNVFMSLQEIANTTAKPTSIVYSLYDVGHRMKTEICESITFQKHIGDFLTICTPPITPNDFIGPTFTSEPALELYKKWTFDVPIKSHPQKPE